MYLDGRHPAASGRKLDEVLDPFNPTDDELRDWAQTDAFEPTQDFDLMVAEIERVPLLVELTSSRRRSFFLRCLYLAVGDAVRGNFNTATRAEVESALDHAATTAADAPAIRRWIADSRTLLAHPQDFDYDAWCDGGLARRAESSG